MKSDQKTIEATGKSVEDAIQSGLSQLGCDITDVHIDILEEGSKGFFGLFGAKLAKVRLTQRVDAFDDLDLESLLRPGASTRVSTMAAPKQPDKQPDKPQPKSAQPKPQTPAQSPKQQPVQDKQPSKQTPAQGAQPSKQQSAQGAQSQSPKQQPAQGAQSQSSKQQPRPERPQPSQPKQAAKAQSDESDTATNHRPPRNPQPRQDKPQSDNGDASKSAQSVRPPRASTPRSDKPQQRSPQTPRPPRQERAPKPPRPDDEPSPRSMIPEGPLPDQDPETLPPESRVAYDYLSQATKLMGVDVKIYVAQNENTLSISMMGDALGILIGRRGETLDALQYLTSLEVNKDREQYMRVALDTENYRAKREDSLNRLAVRMAARARKTGRKVVLEPMNPYERRVLHSMLQNDPYVQTHSEGDEPNRRVVITLKPGVAPEFGGAANATNTANAANVANASAGTPAAAPRPPRPPRRPSPAQAAADPTTQAPREPREPRGPRPPRTPRPQRTYPHAQLEKKPLSSILGDDFEQCQNEFDERKAAETAAQKPQTIMQASIDFSDDDDTE